MAGYPTAAGHPNHSGSYIPRLYATKLLVAFYAATVFGAIATTEHEDQLQKFGDTLRIRTLPDIESKDYVKGQELDIQTPEGGYIDLVIDKGKYWAIAVNDLDKKQIDVDYVTKWSEHASTKQKIAIDSDILSNIYGDVHADNKGSSAGAISGDINLGTTGTPIALTRDNIVQVLVEHAGLVLDEQNVPDEGRWVLLPSWATARLKTSDLKDASLTGDGKSTLRNGRIGMIDRFEVYQTNQLATNSSDSATNAMFGQPEALAFASQMTNTETLKNPKDFGDIIRSLQAYGYKVLKPEAMGHLYCSKG